MKLRTNMFLIFSTLIVTIMLLQWWVLTTLDKDIRKEISDTAFQVSRDTASAMVLHQIEVRRQKNSKIFKKTYWEWQKTHPSNAATDIYIELVKNSKNSKRSEIKLMGPGLQETITVSQSGVEKSFNGVSIKIIYYMSAILLLGIIIAAYFSHQLTKPLKKLSETAIKIGRGELGEQIIKASKSTPEEIATAIRQFNVMSARLSKLEIKNRHLQEQQQLKDIGEIARAFAHSLRNPLNTLGLAVDELVATTPDDKRKNELNSVVNNQLQRIDGWVKNFMSLSDVNFSELEKININELIISLVKDYKKSNPKISWKMVLQADCEITGFVPELQSMLQVLFENALEASSDGQEVKINLTCKKNHCHVEVLDQGKGISEEMLEQVFSPQVSHKENGFGMGLYIAKSIAKTHYMGDIRLTNRKQEAGLSAILIIALKRSDKETFSD